MSEQRNYDWNSFEYLMGMVKGFCWGKASTIWKSSKSDDDNERINVIWNLDKTINRILDNYEDILVDTGKQIGLDVVLDCLNYFKPDDDDDDNNNWKIEKQDNKIQVSVNNAPLFLFWVEDGKVWSKDKVVEDQDDFTNRICENAECEKEFDLKDPHYYDEGNGVCYCSKECYYKQEISEDEKDKSRRIDEIQEAVRNGTWKPKWNCENGDCPNEFFLKEDDRYGEEILWCPECISKFGDPRQIFADDEDEEYW